MKAKLAALVATPLLGLSSLSFAQEPVTLTAAEMDGVTAAGTLVNVSHIYVKDNNVNAPILSAGFIFNK
jgi:hypothetical protein